MRTTPMAQAGTLSSEDPLSKRRDFRIMGLVGIAHAMSHFSQLALPMLSRRMSEDLGYSFIQLGFVLTVFYVTSCLVQTSSGFVVDKKGARPMLFIGLSFIIMGLLGYALSSAYWMLLLSAVSMGIGNGVFHPTDYTLLNKLVAPKRLSHAYSIHGVTGNLGWALAPVYVIFFARQFDSWRIAMVAAAALVAVVLLIVIYKRHALAENMGSDSGGVSSASTPTDENAAIAPAESVFAFLRLPAIWLCMAFFFFYALSNSAIQTYSSVAVQGLFGLGEQWAALCVTTFMVASAAGTLWGGFLAADSSRCSKIVGVAFSCAACMALLLAFLPIPGSAVPVMFALMGAAAGVAGPSRDMIVRQATPAGASGRVFGVVYAGLDIGQSVAPMIYGRLMDHQNYAGLFIALAIVQMILIGSAFTASRQRS